MAYLFDILFKKKLKGGSIRIVTYRHILKNPLVFNGEPLSDVEGWLSTVREGVDIGYSLNSLMRKCKSSYGMIDGFGQRFSKGILARFFFSNPFTPDALRMRLVNAEGNDSVLLASFIDSFDDVAYNDNRNLLCGIVPLNEEIALTINDEKLYIAPGQFVLCSRTEYTVLFGGQNKRCLVFLFEKSTI